MAYILSCLAALLPLTGKNHPAHMTFTWPPAPHGRRRAHPELTSAWSQGQECVWLVLHPEGLQTGFHSPVTHKSLSFSWSLLSLFKMIHMNVHVDIEWQADIKNLTQFWPCRLKRTRWMWQCVERISIKRHQESTGGQTERKRQLWCIYINIAIW